MIVTYKLLLIIALLVVPNQLTPQQFPKVERYKAFVRAEDNTLLGKGYLTSVNDSTMLFKTMLIPEAEPFEIQIDDIYKVKFMKDQNQKPFWIGFAIGMGTGFIAGIVADCGIDGVFNSPCAESNKTGIIAGLSTGLTMGFLAKIFYGQSGVTIPFQGEFIDDYDLERYMY